MKTDTKIEASKLILEIKDKKLMHDAITAAIGAMIIVRNKADRIHIHKLLGFASWIRKEIDQLNVQLSLISELSNN